MSPKNHHLLSWVKEVSTLTLADIGVEGDEVRARLGGAGHGAGEEVKHGYLVVRLRAADAFVAAVPHAERRAGVDVLLGEPAR